MSKSPTRQTRTHEPDYETRAFAIQIKAAADDGTIEGYGSVFGVKDSYGDVIAPGAFANSLAEHQKAGSMPALLWQHDPTEPIGVWTSMTEDGSGLRVRGQLAMDTRRGREAHALCKMGAINGLSIGFVSKDWAYDQATDVRTLAGIDLWEVSLVTFPANQAARVTGVKAAREPITTIRQAEVALRDAGLTVDQAKETISAVKRVVDDEREAKAAQREALETLKTLFRSI